jgi:hypothetical protein
MASKGLLSKNFPPDHSQSQRRPARRNDADGSLEGESPNADAVWTT